MKRIPVRSGGRPTGYPVVLEAGGRRRVVEHLSAAAPAVRRWAVISDDRVAPLHAGEVAGALADAGLGGELLTFPHGERNKNRAEWTTLTDRLLELGYGRDGGVVAVGGGVTGDLAGFVAATFMRGIPVAQLPTSLVAMIDASVGGKTGVDTAHGKNLVGAFHPPVLVLADPETIATLPGPERAQGLAEALKHGAILDRSHAEEILSDADALLAADPEVLERVVGRSVEIKAEVVSRDELEAGMREVLNFGHTVGHALELEADFALPHGDAVALGMVLEAGLGEAWGVTEPGTADWLRGALERVGLPVAIDFDPLRIAELTARDKKARGTPRVVLLDGVGRVAKAGESWSHRAPVERIAETLATLGPTLAGRRRRG